MKFAYRSIAVALVIFLCALAGIFTQHLLAPSDVLASKAMIGYVVVLVGSMLSVVLGLLVWHSHGLFNAQQSKLHTLAGAIARLEFILRRIGPEAIPARAILQEQVLRIRGRFWPAESKVEPVSIRYNEVRADVFAIQRSIDSLRPADEEQRQNLAAARDLFSTIIETKMSMIEALGSQISRLLINVLLAWACVMFFGYGLVSGTNALTVFMAVVGSLAVGSAIFLILELADPFSGLFRISSKVIDTLIEALPDLDDLPDPR